jgi:hypothetical protein
MSNKRRIKAQIRKLAPSLIDHLQISIGKKDKTHGGEFSTLAKILENLRFTGSLEFVDIGAGDGFNMSIAYPLSKSYSCRGLLIEPNNDQLNFARRIYQKKDFHFCSEPVTPNNVSQILRQHDFDSPFYIKIDIDSFDLDVLRGLLASGIRPTLFSIEINELFPPPIKFELRYNGAIENFRPPLFGCSLQCVFEFAREMDYGLVELAGNNAFFASRHYTENYRNLNFMNAREAYESGFLLKDWEKLYPWDIEFKSWLYSSKNELCMKVKSHKDFDVSRMVIE